MTPRKDIESGTGVNIKAALLLFREALCGGELKEMALFC